MASTLYFPSLSSSTTGPLFSSNHPHSPPSSVTFRPHLRVSAARTATADVASTAESQLHPRIPTPGSLYEVLGIQMGATCQEIKIAYRRLARNLHPDVAAEGNCGSEFLKVQEAYETLSDPEKRANYNRSLFMRWRCMSGSAFVAMSATSKTTSGSSGTAASSGFSGYTRRRWETDQCW